MSGDVGEPEDRIWSRDGQDAVDRLNTQHAEILALRAEVRELSALASFYRSCALSGEQPGDDAEEVRAKVRKVLAEQAAEAPR